MEEKKIKCKKCGQWFYNLSDEVDYKKCKRFDHCTNCVIYQKNISK